jgi:UPF0716 protein FxsA
MFARILLLFLITPVVELALLIKMGEWIGFWPTVAIILATALAGSYLAKREGLSVWRQFNDRLNTGGLPGTELLDGVIILVAGALLITPGVLTDFAGFIGLLPPTRALIRKVAMRRIKKAMDRGTIQMSFGGLGADGWGYDSADFAPGYDQANHATWQGTAAETPHRADSIEEPDAGRRDVP